MATKIIVDCSTGVSEEVELTAEELAAGEAAAEAYRVSEEAREAAATQAATEKASGNAKLKALGLTDAEIAALVG